jgi:hypothetical protein
MPARRAFAIMFREPARGYGPPMPHLMDARTGQPRPLAAPGTRRLLAAYCPGSLRAALTADLIRRTGERHNLVVTVVTHTCDASEPPDLMRFNIHPPTGVLPPDTAPDVHVLRPGDTGPWPAGRIDVPVGDDPGTALVAAGGDPLALRLAVLARHRTGAPPTSVAEAWARLTELRRDVAPAAESPSAPMPASRIAAIHRAVDDDLDTPRALILMEALRGDPEVAAGSRFEALVHLDRTLGLDLAQDIGRVS